MVLGSAWLSFLVTRSKSAKLLSQTFIDPHLPISNIFLFAQFHWVLKRSWSNLECFFQTLLNLRSLPDTLLHICPPFVFISKTVSWIAFFFILCKIEFHLNFNTYIWQSLSCRERSFPSSEHLLLTLYAFLGFWLVGLVFILS